MHTENGLSYQVNLPSVPYPGLRPFEKNEWGIYFGREPLTDEIIKRLYKESLLVVHGDSGCGKSSLIRAGVLSRLEQESSRDGIMWETVIAQPLGSPLRNLSNALASIVDKSVSDPELTIRRILNYGKEAAGHLAQLLRRDQSHHICLLIDQFEELFSFARDHDNVEAQLYTQLLIGLFEEKPPGLYCILTMRSEFLGSCARYEGFADTVNRVQYLLPQMSAKDLVRAIQEPATLYNGCVNRGLALRLIADARGGQDQLPLIQHSLMLLYRENILLKGAEEYSFERPWQLNVKNYNHQFGLKGLLSDHADRVLQKVINKNLDIANPEGCASDLFRALTDIDTDGNAIRRPQTVKQLASITGVPISKLKQLLYFFRADGVSFIKPYGQSALLDDQLVDISHEALIRSWRKIADANKGWLAQEFEAGLIWKSLQVQSTDFAADPKNVISAATTVERAKWLSTRNSAWAVRYGGGWEQVQELVKASQVAAINQKRKERELLVAEEVAVATQAKQRLTFIGLVITSVLLLAAGGLYYLLQGQLYIAEQAKEIADRAREDLEKELNKREVAQLQTAELSSFAAGSISLNETAESILADIQQTTNANEIAVLIESLTIEKDNTLDIEKLQIVTKKLLDTINNSKDEDSLSSIANALDFWLTLIERNGSYDRPIRYLTESISASSARQLYWDLADLHWREKNTEISKHQQVLFQGLILTSGIIQPRLYIHISTESQRKPANQLMNSLRKYSVYGSILSVPGVQKIESKLSQSEIRCFKQQECNTDAWLIAQHINTLLTKPRIEVQDMSVTRYSTSNIRQRHYELWFGVGGIQLNEPETIIYED